MSDQTDFFVLYRELGIEPDCTVDEFRLAYRRRVADLHPDRGGASGEDALKALNLRYAAALDFQRHYDRLPGASPAPVARVRPVVAKAPSGQLREDALSQAPEWRRPSKFVVYGIMLAVALLVWWLSRNGTGSPWFQGGIAVNERESASSTAMALEQGMSPHEVLDMLGEPDSRESGDKHWVYGPSWVRFECSKVVDWHSSMLRPLRASRAGPSAGAGVQASHPRGSRC